VLAPYPVGARHQAVFKGHTSKGMERNGREREEKVTGKKGRGGGGRDLAHPKMLVLHSNCGIAGIC